MTYYVSTGTLNSTLSRLHLHIGWTYNRHRGVNLNKKVGGSLSIPPLLSPSLFSPPLRNRPHIAARGFGEHITRWLPYNPMGVTVKAIAVPCNPRGFKLIFNFFHILQWKRLDMILYDYFHVYIQCLCTTKQHINQGSPRFSPSS